MADRRCALFLFEADTPQLLAVRVTPDDYLLDVLLYPGLWLERADRLGLAWVSGHVYSPFSGSHDENGVGRYGIRIEEWIAGPRGPQSVADWLNSGWRRARLDRLVDGRSNPVHEFLRLGLVPTHRLAQMLGRGDPAQVHMLYRRGDLPAPLPVDSEAPFKAAQRLWWLGDVLQHVDNLRIRRQQVKLKRRFDPGILETVRKLRDSGTAALPVTDVARITGRSVHTVWAWIRSRLIEARKGPGRLLVVDLKSLESFILKRLEDEGVRVEKRE